jgi:hypothetical protein
LSRRGIAVMDVLASIFSFGGTFEQIRVELGEKEGTDIVSTFDGRLNAFLSSHALVFGKSIGPVDLLIDLIEVLVLQSLERDRDVIVDEGG